MHNWYKLAPICNGQNVINSFGNIFPVILLSILYIQRNLIKY